MKPYNNPTRVIFILQIRKFKLRGGKSFGKVTRCGRDFYSMLIPSMFGYDVHNFPLVRTAVVIVKGQRRILRSRRKLWF